jgi:hypothetical protein
MHPKLRVGMFTIVLAITASIYVVLGNADLLAAQKDRFTPHSDATNDSLTATANEVFGLKASHLEALNIQGQLGGPVTTDLTINGDRLTLRLSPHSVRAEGFEVRAQVADGSWQTVDPGPVKTLRGYVQGVPGSIVAGALLQDGLTATIRLPGGERHWVEPLDGHVPGADHLHVVYAQQDVLPNGGSCGSDAAEFNPQDVSREELGGMIGGEPKSICVAELATDADVEYFNDYGSVQAVQDRISLVINTMNVQYETEVNITHQLTTMLVRTSEPDPYSSLSNNDLICQFINEWTNNQQAIHRDLAHLFTGKQINGGVIGQAAELGSTCEPDGCTTAPCNCESPFGTKGSYCFAWSDFDGNFACATDLSAHELGHLWSGVHCSCSSPPFTMNPFITCANTFSAATRVDIANWLASTDCVECETQLTFEFPLGQPDMVDPNGGTTVRVEVLDGAATAQPGSGLFYVSIDGGPFNALSMTQISDNVYDATFPAGTCGATALYYFSVDTTASDTLTEPPTAPTQTFSAIVALGESIAFEDDFDSDLNWTVVNVGLVDGAWERAVPSAGAVRGDPPSAYGGSGQCYVTDNVAGNSDVDGGSTTLISPVIDASGVGIATISYARWFHNSFGDTPFTEIFTVEVSDDAGSTWSVLEVVGPTGTQVSGGWFFKQFDITDAGIIANNQFMIRFTTQDPDPGAVVEAGVDAVELRLLDCKEPDDCPADLNGDNEVNITDLLGLLACYQDPCAEGDLNGDGNVDITDLLLLLSLWGLCP